MFPKKWKWHQPLRDFMRDDGGMISMEWVVAVSVVVMMAVPVLAVISDGSEQNSEDVVVSIEDTTSFGGGGIQPGDHRFAPPDDDEPFVPGADKGVGFDDEDRARDNSLRADQRFEQDTPNRPSYFARVGSETRRDKPGGGFAGSVPQTNRGGGSNGGGVIIERPPGPGGGNDGGRRGIARQASKNLPYQSEHCVDPDEAIQNTQDARIVVASGR